MRQSELQPGAVQQEDVEQARDDEADDAHHHERAHRRQAALGRVAVEAEARESRRGGEERPPERSAGVDHEQRRHRQADQRREGDEGVAGGRHRHRIDAGGDVEHQRERREHDQPAQRRDIDRMAEIGQRQAPAFRLDRAELEGRPGDQPGHAEPEGHVVVDADHVGAQALIDGDAGPCEPRAGTRVGVAVIVGHGRNLLIRVRRSPRVCPGARPSRIIWRHGAPPQGRSGGIGLALHYRLVSAAGSAPGVVCAGASNGRPGLPRPPDGASARRGRRSRGRGWSAPGRRRRAPSPRPAGAR